MKPRSQGAQTSLLSEWINAPISRRSLLGSALLLTFSQSSIGKAFGVNAPVITQILGRPTNNSAALSILSTLPLTAYVEFGTSKSKYSAKTKEMAILANDRSSDGIQLTAIEDTRVLLVAGQPLGEPIAQHGPFVMNTRQELMQAVEDFRAGRMA